MVIHSLYRVAGPLAPSTGPRTGHSAENGGALLSVQSCARKHTGLESRRETAGACRGPESGACEAGPLGGGPRRGGARRAEEHAAIERLTDFRRRRIDRFTRTRFVDV